MYYFLYIKYFNIYKYNETYKDLPGPVRRNPCCRAIL